GRSWYRWPTSRPESLVRGKRRGARRRLSLRGLCVLRRRERAAADVAVAEARGTVGLRRRLRYRASHLERLPERVHRWTICGVACVVPDRRSVRVGRHGVDVVAE